MKIAMISILGLACCAAGPTTAPSTQPAPLNTQCPLMNDHKADPSVTVQRDGKTVAFCCKDCIDEFNKDPEKYMKNLK